MNAVIVGLIIIAVLVLVVGVILVKSIALIPQAEAAVIERLGRYTKTVSGQLTLLVPFVDRIRARIDLRERVVSFAPQPVITEDNLTVLIDTVVYFQVTVPQAAVYEINDYIVGVEQLATTTLRNVVGGMTLEETLTSRDSINAQLRGVLDEATSRWGLRVARVELKSILPPPSIQESMEKQMKADREKRATILTAEGQRESAIKTAEGNKQSQILYAEGAKAAAILTAEGERQSRILQAQGDRAATYLRAEGEAKSIQKVFAAIKAAKPTPELLAYQYLQQLPEMAKGEASKVWVVPSDFGSALQGFARSFGVQSDDGVFRYEPTADDGSAQPDDTDMSSWFETAADPKVAQAVAEAEAVARKPVDDDPLLARPRTDPGIDQAGASDQPGWQTPAIDPGRVEQ
ncbi:SPFH domain-containing protein [Williamsia sp. DF01-3]|uniref:SPFH domain-containing protein n=1 Tax=Williamsia sp. DF01-3 TaxID=2934157 RepID=UPI001FF12E1F|nr:SPFH domain-containing protein [Williamsia sp. DF01-3]MCK0518716.1 SPFH/Band 7/PHB domain protein [Williamsia sp. DF01-3]